MQDDEGQQQIEDTTEFKNDLDAFLGESVAQVDKKQEKSGTILSTTINPKKRKLN